MQIAARGGSRGSVSVFDDLAVGLGMACTGTHCCAPRRGRGPPASDSGELLICCGALRLLARKQRFYACGGGRCHGSSWDCQAEGLPTCPNSFERLSLTSCWVAKQRNAPQLSGPTLSTNAADSLSADTKYSITAVFCITPRRGYALYTHVLCRTYYI